ncbi:aspartyl-tRNA(Asn)/glutamyl-tRNA(Gln) amidotransferase subunit B [Hymenobacter luteus]|uniref:Aspartyl/glutamyl-tRNA(Asn/Gln) amidotransferase subunit B n=2 Tax=Hymenobacter TaxID=89966 RepID=A0A7W9T2M4_9BACT|nr:MULTISPECIES: Asp-tRNA(Asn)/Glu-tRNA(Gln) amidotransferase subunit GatB [Hymenobacter]MBB4601887.1 aspartyl-tRNA(Asn)/glutamyl-tRNA(Gln) amidotransferase subunit B [Hymenobacter latericoloratus]MBB6059684.1 aspartyl-tRNA(Asn)/glutamyl-tRNA(Gln) amidotransferase subunit B [Hymenobacter luteus]
MDESLKAKYQPVIGLEVHAQLLTRSKMYSSDENEYGALPNNNLSVITLGHPGTLPRVNYTAVEYAMKMGLATNCQIRRDNLFARKNYFYPDLPKGYQITQDKTPICTGGHVEIRLSDGSTKKIGITRIHMEEDAGKSMHLAGEVETLVDLNRAGVPLIEIVSEPDIRTSEEAYAYLAEIKKLVQYLGICDGNMEEGSLRCDANISVMLKGADQFGTKVEVKNMNSFRNVQRAIDYEIERQIALVEAGEIIDSETRGFDAQSGTTSGQRSKETMNDYRYFPEPDLPPVIIDDEWLHRVQAELPALPQQLYARFTGELGLSDYDANVLTADKDVALFFDELTRLTPNAKAAANWVTGPVKAYLNERALTLEQFPLTPRHLADIIGLIDENKVGHSVASKQLFPYLLENSAQTAAAAAEAQGLLQQSDAGALEAMIQQVLDANPAKVAEYRAGKKSLTGMFMGELMKLTGGKADPKLANQLLRQKLDA